MSSENLVLALERAVADLDSKTKDAHRTMDDIMQYRWEILRRLEHWVE